MCLHHLTHWVIFICHSHIGDQLLCSLLRARVFSMSCLCMIAPAIPPIVMLHGRRTSAQNLFIIYTSWLSKWFPFINKVFRLGSEMFFICEDILMSSFLYLYYHVQPSYSLTLYETFPCALLVCGAASLRTCCFNVSIVVRIVSCCN